MIITNEGNSAQLQEIAYQIDRGLSAYQIAVENGFVGNEAAWLGSLHGQNGNDAQVTESNVRAVVDGIYSPISHTHTGLMQSGDLIVRADATIPQFASLWAAPDGSLNLITGAE